MSPLSNFIQSYYKMKKFLLLSSALFCALSGTATNWVSLGTGTMTDEMVSTMIRVRSLTYQVEIQKDADNEGMYRVVAPYGKAFADAAKAAGIKLSESQYDAAGVKYMDIDATNPAEVYIGQTWTGVDLGKGEIFVGITTKGNVTLEDGNFLGTLGGMAVGIGNSALACNDRGLFQITLPGSTPVDYSVTLKANSNCLNDTDFVVTPTLGADLRNTYYAIYPWLQEDEIPDMVDEVASEGLAYDGAINLDGQFDEAEKITVVAVGTDAFGDIRGYDFVTLYYVPVEEGQWETLGTGQYTEDLLTTLFNVPTVTMDVVIEESKAEPGRYRVVDPYAQYPGNTDTSLHKGHHHYIYLNATNPDRIYIEESPLGIDFGYGMCRVSSYPNYFYQAFEDWEDVDELEMYGEYDPETRTFSFMETSVLFSMLGFDNGDWYESNSNGEFAIVLPANTGIDGVTTSEEAKTIYYNLQGQRVDNPAKGSVVIERRGDKSTKRIVR